VTALAVGLGLGLFVGAQPGPVSLLCVRSFTCLSTLVALVRDRFGPRLLATVDAVAGAGLLGFAGMLGWRTAHDS
jgi:hypothetical protein